MIESVPNVSEGQRPEVIEALRRAADASPGAWLLDHSADPSHNRSVYTLVGEAGPLQQALLRIMRVAVDAIDLRTHAGVHPRVGAVDVVPFVPLAGATMSGCVATARAFGRMVADVFEVPVFLYEEAAATPLRRRRVKIRPGRLPGLAARMHDPAWHPDFGPAAPHPSAGVVVVGARMPLVAFNVNLASGDVAVARAIAAAVRESSGGLPCVKALGLWLDHRETAQVSMNLTNYTVTSVQAAFDAVRDEARARGVAVLESELIGLIPAAALSGTSPEALQLRGFTASQVLEQRMAERVGGSRRSETT